jgi:membrane protein implicated in regulation of membrane protease activity
VALAVGTVSALLGAVAVGAALIDGKPALAVAAALVLGLPSAYCWRLFSREAGPRARKEGKVAARAAGSGRQAELERRQCARDRILAEIDRTLASPR